MVGEIFGHYQIIEETGFGGMGAVYRAQDTRTGQVVAVKLLPPEYLNDLGLRANFERESRLVAALKHPAIVPVYEFGEQDSQLYISMQYMSNGSLADRLSRGPLSLQQTTHLLERLSSALDYAHEQGVVHRDLKPSNILFDEEDEPYLADFGIAWQAVLPGQPGPAAGGTPAYLSPELASGEEKIDGRSDLYSLGVVLFEMLTGVPPFEGETPLAVMLMHLHDLPPSLMAVDRSLPPSWDRVIQRLLAKRPEDRYATAGEFFAAFQEALEASQSAGTQDAQVVQPDSSESSTAELPSPAPEDVPSPAVEEAANSVSSNTGGWRGLHFLALSLATVLGILLAASLAAFVRSQSPATRGVLLTYDQEAVTLINVSNKPLDLSSILFRRISGDGSATASFSALRWAGLTGTTPQPLSPGACYQLLRGEAAPFTLEPGQKLPAPEPCRVLQGWLAAPAPESLFWVATGDSLSFQVIVNGLLVQTCTIASGSCRFSFSQP